VLNRNALELQLGGKAEFVAVQASGNIKATDIDLGLFTLREVSLGGDLNAGGIGLAGNAGLGIKNNGIKAQFGAGATAGLGARGQITLDVQLNTQRISSFTHKFNTAVDIASRVFNAANTAFDIF
jgi:hypothetical protein